MKTIKNYNPELGITLNDLRMLQLLEDDSDLNLIGDVLECVEISIRCNTSFTFPYKPKQVAYDILMEKALSSVKEYEDSLVSQGYTMSEIEQYHLEQAELSEKREEY